MEVSCFLSSHFHREAAEREVEILQTLNNADKANKRPARFHEAN